MKPYLLTSIIALSIITSLSCKKKDTNTSSTYVTAESITIAALPGFAPANTPTKFFLINKTGVYQDTTNTDPQTVNFKFDYQLSSTKHNQVKTLLSQIPASILQENGQYYNDSLTADCGINVVTAVINGATYKWSMEECTEGLATHVKPFASSVGAAVTTLQ